MQQNRRPQRRFASRHRAVATVWRDCHGGAGMKKLEVAVLAVLLFVVLVLIFVAFILSGMVRTRAVAKIEEMTGRQVSIADIAINPLTAPARSHLFRAPLCRSPSARS